MNVQISTRQKVIWWRKRHPKMSGTKIAHETGVTKQRVSEILKNAHLPNRHCQKYICLQCRNILDSKRLFCNQGCRIAYNYPMLICYQCGVLFSRYPTSRIISDTKRNPDTKYFCANKCKGKYYGKHHVPSHKPHRNEQVWQNVWQKHLETGYGNERLSRLTGVPHTTVSKILHYYRNSL